jgi:hypothetical protein
LQFAEQQEQPGERDVLAGGILKVALEPKRPVHHSAIMLCGGYQYQWFASKFEQLRVVWVDADRAAHLMCLFLSLGVISLSREREDRDAAAHSSGRRCNSRTIRNLSAPTGVPLEWFRKALTPMG